jgi:hypothetical protein
MLSFSYLNKSAVTANEASDCLEYLHYCWYRFVIDLKLHASQIRLKTMPTAIDIEELQGRCSSCTARVPLIVRRASSAQMQIISDRDGRSFDQFHDRKINGVHAASSTMGSAIERKSVQEML